VALPRAEHSQRSTDQHQVGRDRLDGHLVVSRRRATAETVSFAMRDWSRALWQRPFTSTPLFSAATRGRPQCGSRTPGAGDRPRPARPAGLSNGYLLRDDRCRDQRRIHGLGANRSYLRIQGCIHDRQLRAASRSCWLLGKCTVSSTAVGRSLEERTPLTQMRSRPGRWPGNGRR
jgi:hypothetical protein